jgi:hypothetical protein
MSLSREGESLGITNMAGTREIRTKYLINVVIQPHVRPQQEGTQS